MITINNYKDLRFWVSVFAEDKTDLLIIEGRAGLGKSRIVNETLNGKAAKILGHCTPLGFYLTCFYNTDRSLIVDDIESLLTSKELIGLLKQICETEKEKTISWISTSSKLKDAPSEFKTSSKVCIVCNDFRVLTKKIHAVQDRGWHIRFEPTVEEILSQIALIKDKSNDIPKQIREEVYGIIEKYAGVSTGLSLRNYVKGCELAGKTKDWKDWLLKDLQINEKLILVNSLMERFDTDKQRLAVWMAKGYSERSYWLYKKKYQQHCKTAIKSEIYV